MISMQQFSASTKTEFHPLWKRHGAPKEKMEYSRPTLPPSCGSNRISFYRLRSIEKTRYTFLFVTNETEKRCMMHCTSKKTFGPQRSIQLNLCCFTYQRLRIDIHKIHMKRLIDLKSTLQILQFQQTFHCMRSKSPHIPA